MIKFLLATIGAALLLGACAHPAARQHADDHVADVRAAAGEPVTAFTFFGDLYSWEPLTEHSLLVYTRPREAWLLEVGPCPQLMFTPAIGLTSNVGRVSAGFDSVRVHDGDFPCRIQQIRPVDIDALREQKQRREVDSMPRTQAPAAASSS